MMSCHKKSSFPAVVGSSRVTPARVIRRIDEPNNHFEFAKAPLTGDFCY
jgi:hypothetical protein